MQYEKQVVTFYFVFDISEDLKLQRNPDNYAILRCTSTTASSISSSGGMSSRMPPMSGGSGTGNSASSSLTGSAPSNTHGDSGGLGIHAQGSSASSASNTTVASSSPSSSAASSTTASTATTAASTPQPNHRHGSGHHHTPHHHSEVIADRTDFHITKVRTIVNSNNSIYRNTDGYCSNNLFLCNIGN